MAQQAPFTILEQTFALRFRARCWRLEPTRGNGFSTTLRDLTGPCRACVLLWW
jgi:hypothetical protein